MKPLELAARAVRETKIIGVGWRMSEAYSLEIARAVLLAVREPTISVDDDKRPITFDRFGDGCDADDELMDACWRAMVDKVLEG